MAHAWSVIALGSERQYGGNTGYSDDPSRLYVYDSAVGNHKQVQEGDLLFVRDRTRLLGIGTIANIKQYTTTKERLRCPQCHSTAIKARKHSHPKWRCTNKHEFATPQSEMVSVTGYEANYADAFVRADGPVSSDELKRATLRPSDQLSIEEIAPGRLPDHLRKSAPNVYGVVAKFLEGISLNARDAAGDQKERDEEPPQGKFQPTIGDARDTVWGAIKQRRGQRKFRNKLIKRYGAACMISGCAVLDVVEAAHISAFRGPADHHADNGLLLRADLHTLFDLNLLAIHPDTLKVHFSNILANSDYTKLGGGNLRIIGKRRPAQEALKARWKVFAVHA